jgi:mannonate dehydratase
MRDVTEENLQFARQIGVTDLVLPLPDLDGGGYYDFLGLVNLRTRIEAAGLRFAAIQNVPAPWYEKIRYGLPGRDQQIENYCKTLTNMGRAGIPIFGYNFHAVRVWRTSRHTRGRGGALVTSYDHRLMENAPLIGVREIGEEELWENFAYFIQRVMPVAEEAGVKMALHPDDPPLSPIAGGACLFRSVESFQRVLDMVPSPSNGLLFCQGCFTEMETDVFEAIRHFGRQGKIFYVHFRNVKGRVPKFDEAFVDDGDVDMYRAMQTYKEVGFDGPMIPDHLPRVVGDSPYSHRSRAHAIGYMKALMTAVNAQGD